MRLRALLGCLALVVLHLDTALALHVTHEPRRRAFLNSLMAGVLLSSTSAANAATPMITTDEFKMILRDSASSIRQVEFSGPKSETVIVQLIDETAFGLNDVIESSTDPRSPLKIAALCRENSVNVKFVDLEAILLKTTKRKNYSNARVLEAAEKEAQKKLRMEQDEELRQSELKRMD